jgi:uncharacterized repeat protein (TIGR03803 family)
MRRIVGAFGKAIRGKRAYAVLVVCAAAASALPAQTYTTLYNFDYYTGAAWPDGGLVQASDGFLYGTTYDGAYGNTESDGGTIFKMSTSGALTTIDKFCHHRECPAWYGPLAPLIQATDGNLYGTTFGSPPTQGRSPGSVYGITRAGLKPLHIFCTQTGCPDGLNPGPLVQGFDGGLYGTTEFGGSGTIGFTEVCATGYTADGCGTVFKVTLAGEFTKLYTFCLAGGTCADGATPSGGLVQTASGDLYGTTLGGGNNDAGTVFKITPAGTLTTLYAFCGQSGCPDGLNPSALFQAPGGDLYGTTYLGGTGGLGTVFKINQGGTLTTVYSFCSGGANCPDGANPVTGLFVASDGNLYGSTAAGGPTGVGTIFGITPGGTLTTLYGAGVTTLMQDTNGVFYGTTSAGGTYGFGTVFSLAAGLPAFVKTIPTGGRLGAAVTILGSDLTGSTSVTFNGAPAVFNVVSSSEITATVPEGASSGTVQVVTPGGTLSSNLPFGVLQ